MGGRVAVGERMATKKLDFGGPVVFAMAPDDDVSANAAREWVQLQGYTREDVTIKKRHGVVVVLALRRLW